MTNDRFPVDDPMRARATDPETSHEAAAAITGTEQLGKRQHYIVRTIVSTPGLTEKQVFEMSGEHDRTCVSPLFARLRATGWIYNAPKGSPHRTRRDPVTGRRQITWWPTPKALRLI